MWRTRTNMDAILVFPFILPAATNSAILQSSQNVWIWQRDHNPTIIAQSIFIIFLILFIILYRALFICTSTLQHTNIHKYNLIFIGMLFECSFGFLHISSACFIRIVWVFRHLILLKCCMCVFALHTWLQNGYIPIL